MTAGAAKYGSSRFGVVSSGPDRKKLEYYMADFIQIDASGNLLLWGHTEDRPKTPLLMVAIWVGAWVEVFAAGLLEGERLNKD